MMTKMNGQNGNSVSKTTLKRSLKISGRLLRKTDNIILHSRKGFRYAPLSSSGVHSVQRCRTGICKQGSWAKSSLLPLSANKVLSEQSTALHSCIVSGCLPTPKTVQQPQRVLKYLLFGPLQKMFLTPYLYDFILKEPSPYLHLYV